MATLAGAPRRRVRVGAPQLVRLRQRYCAGCSSDSIFRGPRRGEFALFDGLILVGGKSRTHTARSMAGLAGTVGLLIGMASTAAFFMRVWLATVRLIATCYCYGLFYLSRCCRAADCCLLLLSNCLVSCICFTVHGSYIVVPDAIGPALRPPRRPPPPRARPVRAPSPCSRQHGLL